MKYWAEFALALLVAAACGHAPAAAGVPGFAQVGRGSTDIFDRCVGREGQAAEERVIDCTKMVEAMAWQGYSAPRYARALAYQELGKYDLAIADLQQATQLGGHHDRNRPGIYNNLCFDRAVVGGPFDQALADCNQSLALRPGDADALNSRAFVEFKMKNYDAAIADATAALSTDPKLAASLYVRGLARSSTGDVANGTDDIEKAKAIDPKIVQRYVGYGVAP